MKTKAEMADYHQTRWADPKIKARLLANVKIHDAKPENKATRKARASTPEGRAAHKAAAEIWEAT